VSLDDEKVRKKMLRLNAVSWGYHAPVTEIEDGLVHMPPVYPAKKNAMANYSVP
jgi:hypothetical protein